MLIYLLISVIVTVVIGLILKFALNKKVKACQGNNDYKGIKNIKHLKILVLVIVFIFSYLITAQLFSLNKIEKSFVYDLYGNSYTSILEIPLYDENGMKYHYYYDANENKTVSFYVDENNNYHNSREVYLTKGGYIVFLEKDKIQSYSGLYDTIYDDGEHYYAVIHPSWNEQGDLIVDGGRIDENSIIISSSEQEAYRKSHNVDLIAE